MEHRITVYMVAGGGVCVFIGIGGLMGAMCAYVSVCMVVCIGGWGICHRVCDLDATRHTHSVHY